MATIASLVVDLRVDVARFQTDMTRASKTVSRSTDGMSKAMRSFENRIAMTQRVVQRLKGAVVVLAGIGGLGLLTKRALATADSIQKVSDKVGVTTDTLQELRFAAEQTGVAQNTLDMALQRFARRTGEAAQGSGELKDTLAQYGIQLRDSEGRQRAVIDVLRDYADVIRDAESDQERLRLAFKGFDSEGAALVNTLRRGRDGLAEYAAEIQKTGAIMDRDMIERSVKAKDELEKLERVAGTNLQIALAELAPVLIEVTSWLAKMAQAAGNGARILRQMFTDIDTRTITDLETRAASLTRELESVYSQIARLEKSTIFPAMVSRRVSALKDEAAKLNAQLAEIESRKSFLESGRRNAERGKAGGSLVAPPTVKSASEAKKDTDKLVDDVAKRQIDEAVSAYEDFNRTQEEGKRIFEATRTPVEAYNAEIDRLKKLWKEGAISQDTFSRAATAASDRLVDQQNAAEKAAESLQGKFIDGWGLAADAIDGFARRGEFSLRSFAAVSAEVFAAYLRQRQSTNGQISFGSSSGGDSGGFFDFLGFADGGRPPVGVPSIVGERGPELFVPDRAGTIIPNHKMGDSGGRSIVVNQSFYFNSGTGADLRAAAPQIVQASKMAVMDAIRRGEPGFRT